MRGANGLCNALRRVRRLVSTFGFGVPVEMASDGGPEFTAKPTEAFLKRWGVRTCKASNFFCMVSTTK